MICTECKWNFDMPYIDHDVFRRRNIQRLYCPLCENPIEWEDWEASL